MNEHERRLLFERSWRQMVNQVGPFHNLTQRETEGLKEVLSTVVNSIDEEEEYEDDDELVLLKKQLGDLTRAVRDGFTAVQERISTAPREATPTANRPTVPQTAKEDIEEVLNARIFSTEGVETNLDDVEMDSEEIADTNDAVERLRRLKDG